MAWITRIRALFGREKLSKELEEELEFHLSMREQWNVEQGMEDAEARREARLRFGNPSVWRERMSELDLAVLPLSVLRDLRYGARMLRRNAGFTFSAVLALALGIGINTVAFTAYKIFVNAPLNVYDPGRMVNLALSQRSGIPELKFSYPDYVAYRDQLHSFSGMLATSWGEHLTLSDAGSVVSQRDSADNSLAGKLGLLSPSTSDKEFALTAVVSENYFSVLGVAALAGRTFDEMSLPELIASPSVLISENYWQRRFGGNPAMLGKAIRLNGVDFTVIGITPHNFTGTGITVPDFWLPISLKPLLHPGDDFQRNRDNKCCNLRARLAPGVSMGHAQAEMNLLASRLDALHAPHSDWTKPASVLVWQGSAQPFPLKQSAGVGFFILLIVAAVGMVLVVACANVAGLQMARAASRQNELAMRLSLGANQLRLIRQLLTESALLALLAGSVALLFTCGLMKGLAVWAANAYPAEDGTMILSSTPDLGIFAYVFAISVFAGILFGLVPALASSRSALASALKASGGTSPKRGRWLRDLLIGAQVAIAVLFMIAGSLLIRSALRGLKADPGYEIKHAVDLELKFPEGPKYTAERRAALVSEIRARLAALPGVAAVTSANPPLAQGTRMASVTPNGGKPSAHDARVIFFYSYVQPNYFQTLGIPLLLGRNFQSQASQPEPSVILSESAAKHLWPGENPLGRSLHLEAMGLMQQKNEIVPDGLTYQVIGIARNTRDVNLGLSDSEQAYLPLADDQLQDYPILIRTKFDPQQILGAIGPAVSSVDPELVATPSPFDELLRQTPMYMSKRLLATVASVVGLLGLLLTSMGIYGTVDYIVALRTREVGVRMALGAKKRDILGLMLREVTRPVLAGLLAGILLGAGVAALLRWAFHDLGAVDGVSFAGVSALFLVIALLAAYLPSRRAMRVDPVVALRCE